MLVLITLSMDRKLCHGVHQQLNEEDVQMQCSDLALSYLLTENDHLAQIQTHTSI